MKVTSSCGRLIGRLLAVRIDLLNLHSKQSFYLLCVWLSLTMRLQFGMAVQRSVELAKSFGIFKGAVDG